jgi:hypothetical protein
VNDPYARWCERHGCDHGHCGRFACDKPQPLEHDGELICGRCAVLSGLVSVMIPCTPEVCREEGD